MSFRKFATTTIIFLAISTQSLMPKNAQAGFIISGQSGPHHWTSTVGLFVFLGGLLPLMATSGAFCVGDGFRTECHETGQTQSPLVQNISLGLLGLGMAFITLDVQEENANPALVQNLKARYPFIDSSEDISSLALTIQKNILNFETPHQIVNENLSFISIPENEVISALSTVDLSDQG